MRSLFTEFWNRIPKKKEKDLCIILSILTTLSQLPPHEEPITLPSQQENSHNTKIINSCGNFERSLQAYTALGTERTFGFVEGMRKPSPSNYLKKRSKTIENVEYSRGMFLYYVERSFSYDCQYKKAKIPQISSEIVKKERKDKNFIVSNAIETILSTPKTKKNKLEFCWIKKKCFGKIPSYLPKIKEKIEENHKIQREKQNKSEIETYFPINSELVCEMREKLKDKWNEINSEYQKYTHIKVFDSITIKRNKERLEKELEDIEKLFQKIQKEYIFVQ